MAVKITSERLKRIAPNARQTYRTAFELTQDQAWEKYEINTKKRQIYFLAQVIHESMGFTRLEENLNYSEKRLPQVWPSRFRGKPDLIRRCAHNPQSLANFTYGGRLGNEGPNDGWMYRGRGAIQTTGKDNYQVMSDEFGVDFVKNPDLITDPKYILLVAAYEFYRRGCNQLADIDNMKRMTLKINGGYTGLSDRIENKIIIERILG